MSSGLWCIAPGIDFFLLILVHQSLLIGAFLVYLDISFFDIPTTGALSCPAFIARKWFECVTDPIKGS